MNSFIGWIGGKKALRNVIIEKFPEDFSSYIEVFGGAGWVLFGKEKKSSQVEVFNDLNSNLVNLYRCLKYHSGELEKELSYLLSSREIFYDFKEQVDTRGLTDIQRAARYFYMIKISFGNDTRTFATTKKCIDNTLQRFDEIRERLSGVIIENKDFENLISVYDRPGALFYLDPPYHGTEKYYTALFTEDDHIRLKNILDNIKGRFILSYNDDEFIRNLYSDYHIETIERNNTLSAKSNSTKYKELIIMNY